MTIEEPPAAAARFDSLDALRGICALLVALFHFRAPGVATESLLVHNAYLFVDYFFVLSGFVIAFSYGDRLGGRTISLSRFLVLRMGRIYPLHVVMIGAFLLLELILWLGPDQISSLTTREPFGGLNTLPSLATNLLLLQAFGLHDHLTWNGPSWSIAAEMWSYILFGLILVMSGKKAPFWVVGCTVAALLVLLSTNSSIDTYFDFGAVRGVYGFGLGVLTFWIFRRRPYRGGNATEILSVTTALVFVAFAKGAATFAAPIVFAAGIYCLADGRGIVARLLRIRLLQFLGLISYSIYMVHVFLQARMIEALYLLAPDLIARADGSMVVAGSRLTGNLITLAMIAFLIGAAFLSYSLIEKPGRDWTRKLAKEKAGSAEARLISEPDAIRMPN